MKIESIVDRAAKYLENSIITGSLKPGERIKEEEISSRLGISRPPIREAFKILESEGLIKRKPRRGVFVSEITAKDIWEIYTLKMALYGLAATLAIDNIKKKSEEKLEKTVQRMEACLDKEPPDIIRYQNLNESFHLLTIEIAGHQRLKKIVASLQNQVKRFSYRSLADRDHLRSSCRYHRQILDAIIAKDRARAERLTHEHILKGLQVLQRLF